MFLPVPRSCLGLCENESAPSAFLKEKIPTLIGYSLGQAQVTNIDPKCSFFIVKVSKSLQPIESQKYVPISAKVMPWSL